MADKLPHMPLWVYDITTDEDCIAMTLEQRGAYIWLLMRQWIEGSLPNNPTVLSRLIQTEPDGFASVIWPAIKNKFQSCGHSRIINKKLAEHRTAALEKVRKNRQNGRLGGRPKKTERLSESEPNGSIRVSGSEYDSDSLPPLVGDTQGGMVVNHNYNGYAEQVLKVYPGEHGVFGEAIDQICLALQGLIADKTCKDIVAAEKFLIERTQAFATALESSGAEIKWTVWAKRWYSGRGYLGDFSNNGGGKTPLQKLLEKFKDDRE